MNCLLNRQYNLNHPVGRRAVGWSQLMFRALWWAALGACCIVTGVAAAQQTTADTAARKLLIGTRNVPPFAFKLDDGSWSGISIELWREIAMENHWDYEFREMDLPQLLKATEKGEVDAAVAAVTLTHKREKVMDFSHPFFLFLGTRYCRAGVIPARLDCGTEESVFCAVYRIACVSVRDDCLRWAADLVSRTASQHGTVWWLSRRTWPWYLVGGGHDDHSRVRR